MKFPKQKVIRNLCLALLFLFVCDALFIYGFAKLRTKPQKSDAILVLGAAVYTPAIGQRTLTALDLYKQGLAPKIILSGGLDQGKTITEAQYMDEVINQSRGELNPEIVLDNDAVTTFENIQNAKKIVGDKRSITIVSDEFHLARAYLIAKRAGFSSVYLAAPKPSYYRSTELAFYYFREMLAMFDYLPKFIFNRAIVND
jgi:uncharacterized SAM-binding protein YcdF (DUF218 family)